ncbi:hypothetical protein GCM10018965_029510 [Nonomuraea roseola]
MDGLRERAHHANPWSYLALDGYVSVTSMVRDRLRPGWAAASAWGLFRGYAGGTRIRPVYDAGSSRR